MTTPHRTLLQQALDALRQCEFTSPPAQRPIVKDAIAALREALAAPDHFRDVAEKVAPAAPPAAPAPAAPVVLQLWCPETGELCGTCSKTGTCEASMLQAHGIGGGNG